MRVLLVEDDEQTAASIRMMLTNENFICDTTDLGEGWLEIGKVYDYDIILLGLMLPDIDGDAVLRRLRAARVRLRPNDRVRVTRFDQPGRLVRIDHAKQLALVSVGLGQWEVPLDEVFPLDG